jgi:para-aminobenzoate synthetase
VYCGSIGYLGYNRIADLNIAIRTLTYDGQRVRFGAGGAITHLSDPAEEFAEMVLKAEALIRPLCRYFSSNEHEAYRLVSRTGQEAPCTAG